MGASWNFCKEGKVYPSLSSPPSVLFPSLSPFFSLPPPPSSPSLLPCSVCIPVSAGRRPLKSRKGPAERCKLLQRRLGLSPGRKCPSTLAQLLMVQSVVLVTCLFVILFHRKITRKRLQLSSCNFHNNSGIILLNFRLNWTRLQITEPKKSGTNDDAI